MEWKSDLVASKRRHVFARLQSMERFFYTRRYWVGDAPIEAGA